MKREIVDRYPRTTDGKLIIEIHADNVEQLYNHFDRYAPYVKKDLDQNLVDYLIDSVGEISREDFIIDFLLTEGAASGLRTRVGKSVRNYFLYLTDLEYRELTRMGHSSLVLFTVGIITLSLSAWVNQTGIATDTLLSLLITEGLTVAAWVALWHAIATFIINWAPHRRQIKMYQRIANAPIFFHDPPDHQIGSAS